MTDPMGLPDSDDAMEVVAEVDEVKVQADDGTRRTAGVGKAMQVAANVDEMTARADDGTQRTAGVEHAMEVAMGIDAMSARADDGFAPTMRVGGGGSAWPLTLYFDDSCPLCRAEMAAITRCDHAGRIRLVDCSAPGFDDADCRNAGIATIDLMRRLHARDAGGGWRVGVPAVAAAYAAVGLEGLGGFFAVPRLQPVLARLYGWLADHRQGLSRLGVTGLFGIYVGWLARRASRRASRCHAGQCDLPHR